MKNNYKRLYSILMIFWVLSPLYSQENVAITGVDTSKMLKNGLIHLYVSFADTITEEDLPGKEDFILNEFDFDSDEWKEEEIKDVQYNGFKQEEISFILLIDNSGSMYDTLAGIPTEENDSQRIFFVLKALQDLFSSTREFKDSLALYTFNTNIEKISSFTSDRNQLLNSLSQITQPTAEESYTELYRAMQLASDELSKRPGRKVLILLSDGENYTYSENKKTPHPLWGNNLIQIEDVESSLQKRGITLYTIHYARSSDPSLVQVSTQSGGSSYPVASKDELLLAYREIHSKINREFRVSYKPKVSNFRERLVSVSASNKGTSPEFSFRWETFWGLTPVLPWWVYCVLTLLSLMIVFIIHKTPFEKIYTFPHLEVLSPYESEKTIIQISENKTMIAVGREQTVIMDEGEFKNKNDDETGITIIKGPDGKYQMEADHEIMVNNKTVISRELEPGDVIRSEGTLIIFDEPEEDKK
ncbi:VWA domain-containing protein [Oceanispirochaeta crateris]|uniref:VWA domain-containing protein n=1 Tax=Oceanispirochaeta crateris TaxID=2518645 RepID=A0A5C1QLV6_9SPIO|nr:VWA domain-containing protein [Oceanispirochaeta crateris]QEN07526.1 VWA domain-containing protein [Oceanispirochaeta crateris]